jgi:hypothetical protein
MPKYEYTLSLKYTKTIVVEAKDEQEAFDLACATPDYQIVDDSTGGIFDAILEGEVEDA